MAIEKVWQVPHLDGLQLRVVVLRLEEVDEGLAGDLGRPHARH
jgi:hypothetical protein